MITLIIGDYLKKNEEQYLDLGYEKTRTLGEKKELKAFCKIQYPREKSPFTVSDFNAYENKHKDLFKGIKTYDDIKKITIETINDTDKESGIFIDVEGVFYGKKFCKDFCNAIAGKNIFLSFKDISTANGVLEFLKEEPFIFLFQTNDLFFDIKKLKEKYQNLIEPERENFIRSVALTGIEEKFKNLQDRLIMHFFKYVCDLSTEGLDPMFFCTAPNCYSFSWHRDSDRNIRYQEKNDFLKKQQVYIDMFSDYFEIDPFCSFMSYGIQPKLFTLNQKREMLEKYESITYNELLKLWQH